MVFSPKSQWRLGLQHTNFALGKFSPSRFPFISNWPGFNIMTNPNHWQDRRELHGVLYQIRSISQTGEGYQLYLMHWVCVYFNEIEFCLHGRREDSLIPTIKPSSHTVLKAFSNLVPEFLQFHIFLRLALLSRLQGSFLSSSSYLSNTNIALLVVSSNWNLVLYVATQFTQSYAQVSA